MNNLSISVVIPVKNGGNILKRCLEAIFQQQGVFIKEIIVLDSESTDSSVSIAQSFGAQVISVNASAFNHGLTRNEGVKAASGDLVYLTVQDAYISNAYMLQEMAAHFSDTDVKAVMGIQGVPSQNDTNPAMWFQRMTSANLETLYFPKGKFAALTQREQLKFNSWDNVNALYRRSALLGITFKETNYCEDKIWADEAFHAGWKLLRNTSLLVYHYHHMYFRYTLSQTYIIDYFYYTKFRKLPDLPNVVLNILKSSWAVIKKNNLNNLNKLYWIFHNTVFHFTEFLMKILFRLLYAVAGVKGLKWGHRFFCDKVPQGKNY
jgi:rhamnosyltransferase